MTNNAKIIETHEQEITFPTINGVFTLTPFTENETTHLIIAKKPFKSPLYVRIHSECLTGEVFGSQLCDCGEQLHTALSVINKESGILIYLRQEGRGIGLLNKLKAYHLQEQGYDTVSANEQLGLPADAREYTIAAKILQSLNISSIRLLTNNPKKIQKLQEQGIHVERVPLEIKPNNYNKEYLKTKKEKMGHLLKCKEITNE
jgi:3,4-dihydroxy 2-butanone 4-phosphate synthase/GTP cyclohydrolase II